MTDKMREEFEAWYEGHCAPLEADWFKRDADSPDCYEYFSAQEAWCGWKASRAALVVKLPKQWLDQSMDCDLMEAHLVAKALDNTGVRYE